MPSRPADHVLHFVNGDDDDLIFWKRPGDAVATLLLSTREREPAWVTLESLMRSELPLPESSDGLGNPNIDLWTAEELDLDRTELMWVAACFASTRQADEGPEGELVACDGCPSCTGEEPEEHGSIEADLIHVYVLPRPRTPHRRTGPHRLTRPGAHDTPVTGSVSANAVRGGPARGRNVVRFPADRGLRERVSGDSDAKQ
ncbi:hypothetical protein [Streptomyces sp. NPDC055107]